MKRGKLSFIISLALIIAILVCLIPAAVVFANTNDSFQLYQVSGTVGSTIQAVCYNYTLSSTYTVFFNSVAVSIGTVSSSTSFSAIFTVPSLPGGSYSVNITTTVDTAPTAQNFTIVPTLTLSSTSAQVGSQITVSGNGFGANSTVIFYLDNAQFQGVQTTGTGTFSNFSLTVPETYGGNTHLFKAQDAATPTLNSTVYFTIVPDLILVSSAAGQATVSGTGFLPASTITFTFDNATVGTGASGTTGSFQTKVITLPAVSAGSHSLKATDTGGHSDTVTITTVNSISVSPQNGPVGSQVTVTGTGFGAGKTITLTYNNAAVPVSPAPVADNAGAFSTKLTVPNLAAAAYTITANDGSGTASTKFTSTATAGTGTPATGNVGANIPITGYGFTAGANVSIKFDAAAVSTTKADNSGSISTSLKLPDSSSGAHTITATDGTNSISITISLTSSMSTSPGSGVVGAAITVSGTAYKAGATVNINFDSTQVATATANSTGSFSTGFNIPASKAGIHQIVASDGTNSASSSVSVTPSAKINVNSGYAGTSVTISGTAFTPGAQLNVKYDSNTISSTTVATDGSFSVDLKVPVSKVGSHVIAATDGVNNPTFTFSITAATLAAPVLAYPAKDAKADSPAKFQWNLVASLNGAVTYNLQISKDAGFSAAIVDQTGLTSNSYQLSDLEKLESASKDKPYYWRVQAVDAAGDVSPWSTASTFTVGFIWPTWLVYLVYAIVAIVIFVLGFLVGRWRRRGFGS